MTQQRATLPLRGPSEGMDLRVGSRGGEVEVREVEVREVEVRMGQWKVGREVGTCSKTPTRSLHNASSLLILVPL